MKITQKGQVTIPQEIRERLTMNPVLIDSNILIDIFSENPQWCLWSRNQLTELSQQTLLYINPIIYSEISIGLLQLESNKQGSCKNAV